MEILIIDDEKDIRELISDILEDENFTTRKAKDSISALEMIAERLPNLVILDIWLQGSELDGLGILEIIKRKYPLLPVVMISGHGNIETAVSAIKIGAYDYIEKPFAEDKLLIVVKRALENAALKRENAELRLRGNQEADLIGKAPIVNNLRSQIDRVAPTASRVMIYGAGGSGKEVVARLIHSKSKRENGPFVVLNSAIISPEKMELELFGNEDANSISGEARKIGILEKAHNGTLFIDEVADMPLGTQSKMLRILQEQSFERIGGNRMIKVDIRMIAATSRNLEEEIQMGRFRQDLFYRLNVVPIKVPSLAERKTDIPLFCEYFIKRASEMSGFPTKVISNEAIAIMQTYDWPGNVRQLRNVVEWLLIMSAGSSDNVIKADMLPPDIFMKSPVSITPEVNHDILSLPLRDARELFEKQYLGAQLSRFSGNISKTSSFIGMERSALHRKLKSLHLAGHDEEVV